MAIAAIYVLVLLSLAVLYIGFQKQDSTLLMFASLLLFFTGLNITIFGFEELNRTYSISLGFIVLGIAAYIGIRTAMEMIK